MRRSVLPLLLLSVAAVGCNRGPTVIIETPPAAPVVETAPASTPAANAAGSPKPAPLPAPELSPQERYDAALWSAVTLLTDRKYAEALAALHEAQKARDTEQVRLEIARVTVRLEAARAAERTMKDLQTVLIDGPPDEAARLAVTALREFGDTDSADALTRLKRQADTLATLTADNAARAARFRQEAEEAVRANNLRAALIAYDEAAAAGDAAARGRVAEVQATLGRYDEARRRAAELRRDPTRLDDALAAYRAAAAAWDTPQVRQDIDECTFARQCRRDRLGVVEFETRGDVGVPLLGRTIAEDLLPAFKGRFDLVEHEPIDRVCDDLRLQPADLIDRETGRRELARLAGVRYLVLGSVTPLNGLTVHARLLDLETGLIVQTAKVSAPTAEALTALLPQLATMLQLTDDQRLAYEQQLARQAPAVTVAADVVSLPPPPAAVTAGPAAPIVLATTRPPEVGAVVVEDFRQLPPPGPAAIDLRLAFTKDHKVRLRALSVAVELGDDLFRRGRFAEAQGQYQVALGLAPGRAEVAARLDRCKSNLQGAYVSPLATAPRPRAAVLDFATLDMPPTGDRGPNDLGRWAAENVGPYLCPPYDVVDRGELYWYMGRLGITLRDAVVDPLARLYLGRALNVRFIVLGTVRQTPAGLEVVAHLLDTETGVELNAASAVARDRGELKCRLGEIARWLLLDPAERLRREAEAAAAQTFLVEAEAAAKQSNYALAIELTRRAGHKTPGIRVALLLNQFDRQAQAAAVEAQRRAAWEQQQVLAADAVRRQQELAAAAEAARVAAAAEAARVAAAEKQAQRQLACQQLIAQARAARDTQNYTLAAQCYEGALALNRKAGVAGELAEVKARADDLARARLQADAAVREAAARQERTRELTRVQAQVDAERRQRAAAETKRRQLQEEADAKTRSAAAEAARQTELRLKAEAETKRQADRKDRAEAEAKANADQAARLKAEADAKAKADQQARLKAEADAGARADARAKADADAKRQADRKAKADQEARLKAEADAKARAAAAEARRVADARAKADQEARQKAEAEAKARTVSQQPPPPPVPVGKVPPPPPSPPVTLRPPTATAAPLKPPTAFTQQMEAGTAFEKQNKFGDAYKAYRAALQVVPSDTDAARRAEFARHMHAGIALLGTNRKADAAREFEAALRIAPNDPAAIKWWQQSKR